MRTIKFRGKRVDNGEWVYGDLLQDGSLFYIFPIGSGWFEFCKAIKEVIPETVGQFTGLTDKKGKYIYEGDIVKIDSFDPPNYVVSFIEGGFCFTFISGQFKGKYSADIHYVHHAGINQSTIIGNIYDNNELI